MQGWTLTKDIFQILSNIASIVLIGGLFQGIYQVKLLKKDLNDRNRRSAAEKSMEYLAYFEKEIITSTSEYEQKLKEEIKDPADDNHLFNEDFKINPDHLSKEMIADSIVKQRLGIVTILNQLEFYSAVIESRITDEDLLYTPSAMVFCDFVKSNHLWISILRAQGIPYKNLVSLYKKWSKRLEVEKLQLQMLETAHKIKQQGKDYGSLPPIGL
ncbi:DUF4760 domain-containing protein [Paenibacillus sediminis]|uniref:DUF4760 domain-containing protein n=1 Tax=Paenibacillus sediminis TaxID=664909 RepID=A0ABS4H642_9BACL|nr:DUF4760 domain-containing protein [Paenibacillus sediminis]MBP1937995.1 hypothetical protein [Paenibacillus sediminis]